MLLVNVVLGKASLLEPMVFIPFASFWVVSTKQLTNIICEEQNKILQEFVHTFKILEIFLFVIRSLVLVKVLLPKTFEIWLTRVGLGNKQMKFLESSISNSGSVIPRKIKLMSVFPKMGPFLLLSNSITEVSNSYTLSLMW